jgi:hypothetical protein
MPTQYENAQSPFTPVVYIPMPIPSQQQQNGYGYLAPQMYPQVYAQQFPYNPYLQPIMPQPPKN